MIKNYEKEIDLENIQLLQELGFGSFGRVYKAQIKGKFYTIKELPIFKLKKYLNLQETFKTIILNIFPNEHKQLLQYYKIINDHPENQFKMAKINQSKLKLARNCHYVVQEYQEMNLKEYFQGGNLEISTISSNQSLTSDIQSPKTVRSRNRERIYQIELKIKKIFANILVGFQMLLDQNMIYKNIKPENIFIDPVTMNVKLGDYGLQQLLNLQSHQQYLNVLMETGSLQYQPPENIDIKNHFINNQEFDLWSLGVILFQMVFSFEVSPFVGDRPRDLLQDIKYKVINYGEYKFSIYNFIETDDYIQNNPNIIQRYSLYSQEFKNEFEDLIQKIFQFDFENNTCNERISLKEVKSHPFVKDQLEICNYVKRQKIKKYAVINQVSVIKTPSIHSYTSLNCGRSPRQSKRFSQQSSIHQQGKFSISQQQQQQPQQQQKKQSGQHEKQKQTLTHMEHLKYLEKINDKNVMDDEKLSQNQTDPPDNSTDTTKNETQDIQQDNSQQQSHMQSQQQQQNYGEFQMYKQCTSPLKYSNNNSNQKNLKSLSQISSIPQEDGKVESPFNSYPMSIKMIQSPLKTAEMDKIYEQDTEKELYVSVLQFDAQQAVSQRIEQLYMQDIYGYQYLRCIQNEFDQQHSFIEQSIEENYHKILLFMISKLQYYYVDRILYNIEVKNNIPKYKIEEQDFQLWVESNYYFKFLETVQKDKEYAQQQLNRFELTIEEKQFYRDFFHQRFSKYKNKINWNKALSKDINYIANSKDFEQPYNLIIGQCFKHYLKMGLEHLNIYEQATSFQNITVKLLISLVSKKIFQEKFKDKLLGFYTNLLNSDENFIIDQFVDEINTKSYSELDHIIESIWKEFFD